MTDSRLIRLRVELFTAAQLLRGDDLREFWALIDEVSSIRVLHQPEGPEVTTVKTALWLALALALAGLLWWLGPVDFAAGQSLDDIVRESESGQMPSREEFNQRGTSDAEAEMRLRDHAVPQPPEPPRAPDAGGPGRLLAPPTIYAFFGWTADGRFLGGRDFDTADECEAQREQDRARYPRVQFSPVRDALGGAGDPVNVDSTVVLLLAALPLTAGRLDRDAIARQAGCEERVATITIAPESAGEPDGRWIVIVRCIVPVVPTAEILRTPPYEEPRQVRGGCVPSPFAGWCQNGRPAP